METNVNFEVQEVDEHSSIPDLHLSYIIQQILPTRLVGHKRIQEFDTSFDTAEDDDCILHAVGSLAEGFNIPSVIIRKPGEETNMGNYTDLDFLVITKKYSVTFDSSRMLSEKYYALAETNDVHPGYVRLNLSSNPGEATFKNREMAQLKMKLYTLENSNKLENLEIHGPALTRTKTPLTLANYKTATLNSLSSDQVLAIPCNEWPPVAIKWIDRQHNGKWINESILESLVKDGCHFVPTPHRLSKTPEEEWRLSFAATERRIARELITDEQRQVFVFIKILYHQELKSLESITSYHLKTTFLWACERIPAFHWKENMGSCFFFVLDLLLDCISRKNLPHFFIPENNLFEYLSDEELATIHKRVQKVRANPLHVAFDFTDQILIGKACVTCPFRKLLEPVIEDMKAYMSHRDIKLSILQAFVPTSHNILMKQISEGKGEEAVYVATDLHSMMVKHTISEETLGEFCFWNIACHMTDGRLTVAFLEAANKMYAEDPDFDCSRANFGCMCHAAAYRFPTKSENHKEYLRKSETAFLSYYENHEVSAVSNDYALLLMKQDRFDDAIVWLNKVIETNDMELGNVYDASEIMTLDDTLQNEIAEHNRFSSSAVSLAYYLKIQCLLQKNGKLDNNNLLLEFKEFAEKDNLPRTFALLGYCFMADENWVDASYSFARAVDTNTDNEYTRAIKMKKYCDEQIKISKS